MTVTGVPGHLYRRDPATGYWKARGRPDLIPGSRSSLVLGSYEPSADTAGPVTGIARTTVSGTQSLPTSKGPVAATSSGFWRITTAGTIVENVDVLGQLKFEAASCIYRNSVCYGKQQATTPVADTYYPAIDTSSTALASGYLLIQDVRIDLTIRQADRYGVKGRGYFVAERVHLDGPIDGFQVYDGYAKIRGCYGESLHFAASDPNQGPEGSHNDWVQFQGGTGARIDVIGNSWNNAINPYGSSNLGFLVTSNVATPAGYRIEQNWWRTKLGNGTRVGIPINLSIGNVTDFTCRNNQIQLGRDGYHIIARSAIRSQVQAEPGNVDLDTGATIIVQNGG